MLASSGEDAALRRAGLGVPGDPVLGQDPRLQERLDQRHDASVPDTIAHPSQQAGMRDLVEACLDVTFEHPFVAVGCQHVNLGDRVLGPTLRAEAIGAWLEVRLEDRFEDQLERRLHRAVGSGGNPSERNEPLRLGIIRCRTGSGANRPDFTSLRSRARNGASTRSRSRGRTPSIPAARAPRLPRTRAHATVSTAGSVTRLNRSSNRRPGSSFAHRCSLVWIFSTRCCAPITSTTGHCCCGSPVFAIVS